MGINVWSGWASRLDQVIIGTMLGLQEAEVHRLRGVCIFAYVANQGELFNLHTSQQSLSSRNHVFHFESYVTDLVPFVSRIIKIIKIITIKNKNKKKILKASRGDATFERVTKVGFFFVFSWSPKQNVYRKISSIPYDLNFHRLDATFCACLPRSSAFYPSKST